jgi:hypothetical protein
MKEATDNCGYGYSTQGAVKNLFRYLDRFAIELDLPSGHYAELLVFEGIPETSKSPLLMKKSKSCRK